MDTSGLQAIRDLGAVLANVGGILTAVLSAASASGVSSLSVLVEAAGRAFLRSAEGMAILRQIFGGIAAAGQGLVPVLEAIATAIGASIAPAIARLGPMIGDAFRALVPAIAPLGQAVAALAPMIGTVAQQFAGGARPRGVPSGRAGDHASRSRVRADHFGAAAAPG